MEVLDDSDLLENSTFNDSLGSLLMVLTHKGVSLGISNPLGMILVFLIH